MFSITDFISVLGFMVTVFSIGYTLGKDHGAEKNDKKEHKK